MANTIQVGSVRMQDEGGYIGWEDLRIVPGAFQFPGDADPLLSPWQPGGSGTSFKVYKFNASDEAIFTLQLPHHYKEGSDVKAHAHWTPGDQGNEENGHTVAWKLDYSWANIDGTFGASATADMTDTCDGTDHKHLMTPLATLTGAGKTISSVLVCRIFRDVGDTWVGIDAASPILLEFDLHFQINSIGSIGEAAKP